MRPSKLALGTFLALVSTANAYADWSPPGPYTFTQGQTYELYFEQPATNFFLAADVAIQYSPLVYEPIALLPGSLASFLELSPPIGPFPVAGGLVEVGFLINPSFSGGGFPNAGLTLDAGSMFGVRFQVRGDAPLGTESGNVTGDAVVTFGDPLDELAEIIVPVSVSVNATIVPVPEPAIWTSMLAGLVLLGGAATRLRRRATSTSVGA